MNLLLRCWSTGLRVRLNRRHRACLLLCGRASLLLRRVLAVTAPGGEILFSTNHQRFEARFEGLSVGSIEEITATTIPEDYRNRQIHRCWRIVAPKGPATSRR